MSKSIERRLEKLRSRQSAWADQRGQSLIIIAGSIMALLAFVGLAIDLGMVYVERVRASQAADAAALAAAPELPLEDAAHDRALIYLQQNGYGEGFEYDYDSDPDVGLAIGAYVDGEYESDPGGLTSIWIDTEHSRDRGQEDTAYRVRIKVRRRVPMYFMQFIGFRYVAVEAVAEAENINNLDIAVVYDKSGSMEFDTLCYGCWEPSDAQYPNGTIYPLHWSDGTEWPDADHCADACEDYADCVGSGYCDNYHDYQYNDCNYYDEDDDKYYIIIEAEEYSRLSVDYHRWGYESYKTFWIMQRNAYNEWADEANWRDTEGTNWGSRDGDVGAKGRDARGAYISHHPYRDYENSTGRGVSCTWDDLDDENDLCGDDQDKRCCKRGLPEDAPWDAFPAPRVDYDFYAPAPTGATYYVWIRGQGGHTALQTHIFWGIDEDLKGQEGGFPDGPDYDGASAKSWEWRRLGSGKDGAGGDGFWLEKGDHILHLWGGGAGFDVDRIIITTDGAINPAYLPIDAPPNNGRTDGACNPCDARFAGRPGGQGPPKEYRPNCDVGGQPDRRYDDIYDDEQPIRTALEAAKHFVGRLELRFDQAGYVPYSTDAEIRNELECLRRRGPKNLTACDSDEAHPGEEPPCDPACGCFAGVLTNTVLYELDKTRAAGNTNIAGGLKEGIAALTTGGDHFGRPGAVPVIVLMTDGEANLYPGCTVWGKPCQTVCNCTGEDCCCAEDLWSASGENYPPANDCVIYYARLARRKGVIIYTISLGQADHALMEKVAEVAGDRENHYPAEEPEELEGIFDKLYERIFVRLIR